MKKNKSRIFLNHLFTFRVSKLQEKTSEGMYLLIKNKSVITKAQKEADNLLIKFCGRRQNTLNQAPPERKKHPLIHNQVSSYAAKLSQNTSPTPFQAILYSPPSYKRPVSITFTPNPISNNKAWAISPSPFSLPSQVSPPPYQKRKFNNERSSINTVTKTGLTNYLSTTSSWKDELDELTKESNDNMKQLINENNTTMTTILNENINEKIKEFQTILMKTVEEMIAKQMSSINLNMIQTIQ